jgi:hypothetical protein
MGLKQYSKIASISQYFNNPEIHGETNLYLNHIKQRIINTAKYNSSKDREDATKMEHFLNDLKQYAKDGTRGSFALGDLITKESYDKLLQSIGGDLGGLFTHAHSKDVVKGQPFDDIVEYELNIVLQKLFNTNLEFYAGEQKANVKDLTKILNKFSEDFINEVASDSFLKKMQKVTHRDNLFNDPQARSQKVDITTAKINITQQLRPEAEKILSLFSGRNFSVKNYEKNTKFGTRVTLGNTVPLKAFIGALTSLGEPQALAVKAFYAAVTSYAKRPNPELAANIFAIRYYYELTGAGLKVEGEDVNKVDFLIVNNPSGRIYVKSCKAMVYDLLTNDGAYLGKYDPFREVHGYIQ